MQDALTVKLSGALADEIERIGKSLFGKYHFQMELGLFWDKAGDPHHSTPATDTLPKETMDLSDFVRLWRGTVLPASCEIDFYVYTGERGQGFESQELAGNLEIRFRDGKISHLFIVDWSDWREYDPERYR